MKKVTLDNALVLVNEGSYAEALLVFNTLLESGFNRDAIGHRACLLRHLGKYEEAIADYEQLEGDLEANAMLADCLFSLGKFNEASKKALEVLNKDPLNPIAVKTVLKSQRAVGIDEFERDLQSGTSAAEKTTKINRVVSLLEEDLKSFPTSVNPTVGLLLYSLTRACRPTVVIETGSFIGYSGLCIGQALDDNGVGILHSFDIFSQVPPNYISPVLGERDDQYEIANGHIKEAGLSDRVVFHKGDSSAAINETFKDKENIIEMAFIDGDHTIKGCLKDWHAIDKLLKPGGIVAMHDTIPEGCHWMGPHNLLSKLDKVDKEKYRWINLPTFDKAGLGIIQKLSHDDHNRQKPTLIDLIHERLFHDNLK